MTEALKEASPDALGDAQDETQARYDEVIAAAAVDAQEMRDLTERASRLPGLESTSAKVGEEVSDANKILTQAREVLEAYPDMMGAYGRDHCPHCGAEVAVRYWEEKGKSGGGVLTHNLTVEIPAEDNDPDSKRKKREAFVAVSDAEQVAKNLQGQVNEIEAQIETASAAKISLEQAEAKPREDAPDITQAREDLEAARADVLRLDRYNRSRKLHGLITRNTTVVDLLKPEGVRGQVLARSLKVFNREHLAPIVDSTSKDPSTRWPAIEITARLRCDLERASHTGWCRGPSNGGCGRCWRLHWRRPAASRRWCWTMRTCCQRWSATSYSRRSWQAASRM